MKKTTPKRTIRLGTRGSPLALWQAEHVRDALLARWPALEVTLVEIKTTGDRILDKPLVDIGDKGLFTKEIEDAMLRGETDAAVHSLKDLPSRLSPGLAIAAIFKRTHGGDVLVSKNNVPLADIPPGSRIATGSLRRRAQLLHYRPDLQIVDLRGNLNTRFRKFYESDWAGMVLAEAGIVRLQRDDEIAERLPFTLMLPAVGQGALAVEVREGDADMSWLIEPLADAGTTVSVSAERAFLRRLEGGCQVPIAARGELKKGTLTLYGLIADLDGKRLYRSKLTGKPKEAEQLGRRLAEILLERGGRAILDDIRRSLQEQQENTQTNE